MSYQLDWSDSATASIAKLDATDRAAVYATLRDLVANPQPNHGKVGRLEVGWLRVLYEVDHPETGVITLWTIGKIS